MLIGTQLFSACVASFMVWLQVSGLLSGGCSSWGPWASGWHLPLPCRCKSQWCRDCCLRDTEAALAMNSVSYNVGRAVAPVLCIVVISTIGFGWVFALNAISFLLFSLSTHEDAPTDRAQARSARAGQRWPPNGP